MLASFPVLLVLLGKWLGCRAVGGTIGATGLLLVILHAWLWKQKEDRKWTWSLAEVIHYRQTDSLHTSTHDIYHRYSYRWMHLFLQTIKYKARTSYHMCVETPLYNREECCTCITRKQSHSGNAVSKWWSVPQLALVLVVRVWSGSKGGMQIQECTARIPFLIYTPGFPGRCVWRRSKKQPSGGPTLAAPFPWHTASGHSVWWWIMHSCINIHT